MITGSTVACGLIGDPVAHSLSPAMHNAAFRALGLDYTYLAFRVDSRNVDLALAGCRVLGMRGLNVTIPHKTAVLPFLEELSPEAREVGAVNTIVNEGGRLTGYNTDVYGFDRALAEAGFDPAGKKVIILGAGGAARAVAYSLKHKAAGITVITRRESLPKAIALARSAGGLVDVRTIEELPPLLRGAGLLVNATSAGMNPRVDETLVPAELLQPGLTVFDIIYNPMETRLLREARLAGCRVVDGLDMLVYQGAQGFKLWTGQDAPVEIMRAAARAAVSPGATAKKNVSLIGFMGAGKSAAGRMVAQRLGKSFIDTDRLIEKTAGKPICDIFKGDGEVIFRSLESDALRQALAGEGAVISCGGGIVLNQLNINNLKEHSLVIYLRSTPEVLNARLSRSRSRPLLKTGDRLATISQLLAERSPLYEQAADIIIDSSTMTLAQVGDAIIARLNAFPGSG